MLNVRKFFEKYSFAFYILFLFIIAALCFNSCLSNKQYNSSVVIDSLKRETKYLLQDLAVTRTSYNKTIVENDLLKKEIETLKVSLGKLKQIKKPKPTPVKGKDIDSTEEDSTYVPISDYNNLALSFDSLNAEYDSCLFYGNHLLVIIDKKDKIIAKKDSLNARQNKDFDKISEINGKLLKQEYKRGIRKGRKQGAIFAWVTETLALIGLKRVK